MSRTESTTAKRFAFTYPITVHLRDLDGLGHVNNAVYLTYLETARNRWVFDLRGKTKVTDFDFILAHTSVDFRAAAELYDTVLVKLRPTRVGNSSWDLQYECRDQATGRLLIEARSVQVMYNYATGRSAPVPEEFRRILEAEIGRCDGAG